MISKCITSSYRTSHVRANRKQVSCCASQFADNADIVTTIHEHVIHAVSVAEGKLSGLVIVVTPEVLVMSRCDGRGCTAHRTHAHAPVTCSNLPGPAHPIPEHFIADL